MQDSGKVFKMIQTILVKNIFLSTVHFICSPLNMKNKKINYVIEIIIG